jgi:HPt (histidine-containing phosphotransfer) domain-containing protein
MRKVVASDQNRSVIYRAAHSIAGAARNVGAEALAKRASELEQTVGSLSATRIAAEIAALQLDLDVALAGMRTLNASYALPVEGVGGPISERLGAPHA